MIKLKQVGIKIIITNELNMNVFIIDKQHSEIPIYDYHFKDTFPLNIFSVDSPFHLIMNNDYHSIQSMNNTTVVHYMKELFDNPQEDKRYEVTNINEKQFSFSAEILFGYYLNQLKQEIEKKYSIKKFIITLPTEQYSLMKKLKNGLNIFGIHNIEIESFINQSEQSQQLMNSNGQQQILQKNHSSP